MKKRIFTWIFLCGLILPMQATYTILGLGDSLTEGSADDQFVSYLEPLTRLLTEAGIDFRLVGTRTTVNPRISFRHCGFSGRNAEFLDSVVTECYGKTKADIVLLQAGHNHFIEERPVAGIVRAQRSIIRKLQSINPWVKIIVAQVIEVGKLPKYGYIPELNNALATMVTELDHPNVTLVHAGRGFNWQIHTIADKVHTTAQGAAVIAGNWTQAILRTIETNPSKQRDTIKPGSLNWSEMILPAPASAKFAHDSLYIWGASPVKGDDEKYHIFYSQWGRQFGFMAWVTHSMIAHAVGDTPLGPFRFSEVTLPPREKEYWDATTTHNPHIHRFDGKYYLYYTGNRGDEVNVKNGLNWVHRNNQRIGVAYADSPYGPWTRLDRPVIDVSPDSTAHDSQCVANPSVTQMADGRYLMVYKAVASRKPQPFGGPVVHLTAVADHPTGPFVKQNQPIFTCEGADFPAEDPYIWFQDNGYYAIVKDFKGYFTRAGQSLALFYSTDGLDWKPAVHPLVSRLERKNTDGNTEQYLHLERPQLLIENGRPTVLFLAADHDKALTESFNIQIPLK